jgi:ADP-ribose pyrophosphatase
MSQWKIVSQKPVFSAKFFDVKEVVLKNSGKKRIHHVAQRDPIVVIFPMTDQYDIYLIDQYRSMLEKTVLEAISGHVDKNESTIAAAKRELKEESGIISHQLEEIARIEMSASVFKSKVHIFLAKGLEFEEANLEEDEEISVVKMPLTQAVEKVMLGEINHAASMLGILMLDKLRMQKKL